MRFLHVFILAFVVMLFGNLVHVVFEHVEHVACELIAQQRVTRRKYTTFR